MTEDLLQQVHTSLLAERHRVKADQPLTELSEYDQGRAVALQQAAAYLAAAIRRHYGATPCSFCWWPASKTTGEGAHVVHWCPDHYSKGAPDA